MKNFTSLPRNPIRGLWRLLESHRGIYFGSLAALAVTVGAETGGFLLLRTFVDKAITQTTWIVPLSIIALGYFALSLIRGGFSFLSGKFTAFAAENVIRNIRNAIYDHMQRLSFSYHDGMKTGELIQRSTSDVDTLRRFYSEMVHGMARILFLFAINFTTILILEWRLALITIVLIPVMLFVSVKFFGRIHTAYEAYQDQDGALSAVLQENLTGVRIVRAFARQTFEKSKFNDANAKKRKLGYKFMMSHATYWPISELLGGAQSVIGILAGGLMATNGHITIGTYVAYIGLARGIIWPLQQLGRLIAQLSTVSVSYGRVGVVLGENQEDLETGEFPSVREVSGAIAFDSVSFAYDSGAAVLHDISFTCNPGEHVALLGEPGSGKTTLVNLIPRFYSYTQGSITLDGRSLTEYSRHYLRQHIGIVEQEPFLFSTDIRSNISYGVEREVTNEEIEHVAKVASIHDSIVSFPDAYDTIVGERGVTLSGGQKQRIAIARTLLKDPAILILDDSTSAIDAETEVAIREALKKLMKGRTTFIIAHRVQSLMQADQILVFKEGRIIQHGTHESLIDTPGFYNEVFQLQTRIELELEEQLHHG